MPLGDLCIVHHHGVGVATLMWSGALSGIKNRAGQGADHRYGHSTGPCLLKLPFQELASSIVGAVRGFPFVCDHSGTVFENFVPFRLMHGFS